MRSFGTVSVKNYIGTPNMQAANICKSGAMQIAPFTVPWAIYLVTNTVTQMGVLLDVSQLAQIKPFPQIRSIYIDNEGNNVPVWVQFPDTGFTVACQPNAAGWFPVYTNGTAARLYGIGFTPNDFSSATAVFFSDTFIPPYVDNELLQNVSLMKASPTIQRGLNIYNSLYAAPALGDQTVQLNADFFAPAGFSKQLFPVKTVGYYYITGICLNAYGINQGVGAAAAVEALVASLGVSGVLYDFWMLSPTNSNFVPPITPIFNQTGLQLKLDATEDWRFKNGVATPVNGQLELYVNYTYSPL